MILSIDVKPGTIKSSTVYNVDTGTGEKFPIMTIDKDSYIAGAKIESGINFHWDYGTYNLQIGKYCAMAEDILFMIDINHGYDGVFMGEVSELNGMSKTYKSAMRPRGQIIIQNDCWIGHGATIMDGVTIHNGAVVGTNAVVTKDVPPYAIVAGNPARIVKYRFEPDVIEKLQQIAWWDWDSETILKYKEWLLGDVSEFASYFYGKDVLETVPEASDNEVGINRLTTGKAFVYYLDMDEPYSLWKKVIKQFATSMDGTDNELILYLNTKEFNFEAKAEMVLAELALYEECDCYVNICTDVFKDDADLLKFADFYISNRHASNVHRMCKADLLGVKCLMGMCWEIFCNCK